MDLTKLSDADLMALKAGDLTKLSDEGLSALKGSSGSEAPPSVLKDVAMQVPTGLNEGLANIAGAPVDAMSWALRKAGLPIPDNAFGGSQSIKSGLGYIGANPANAPAQTTPGQFARAASNMAASAIIPELGAAGATSMMSPAVRAATQAALGDASAASLARNAAAGAAAGLGSEAAGQATEGTPAEPWARLIGGTAAGVLAGAKLAPKQATRALKTIDETDAAAKAGYNNPELKNLKLQPQPVNTFGTAAKNDLENNAFYAEDHAPVFTQLNRLENMQGPVEFERLDAVRKRLGELAGQLGPDFKSTPTAAAAMRAKGHLDNFIDQIGATNPAPQAVGNGFIIPNPVIAAGNPAAARAALLEARGNAGAAIRANRAQTVLDDAVTRAQTKNSAMNVQNNIRQAFVPYLTKGEAKIGAWTDAEQKSMRALVRGTNLLNAMRYAGNAMGGSGITIGPYVLAGHPLVPAAGYALKKAANIMTQRQAQGVTNQLLERAPINQPIVAANRLIKKANSTQVKMGTVKGALRGVAAQLLMRKYQNGNAS
jgi:hypothetical protein